MDFILTYANLTFCAVNKPTFNFQFQIVCHRFVQESVTLDQRMTDSDVLHVIAIQILAW